MTLELYQLQICPYFDSRVVIYDRKMFIRLDAGANVNSVWLDVKIKSGSIFTKVAQKVTTAITGLFQISQKVQSIWANFLIIIVAKTCQELPNLVTLNVINSFRVA